MIGTLLANEVVQALLVLIVTTLLGLLWKFLRSKGIESEAIDTIRNAIQLVQDTFVDEIKKASADGKLTKEEAEQARNLAWEKALELAKGPVKDVLLKWGIDKVKAIIGRIVQDK